MSPIASSPQTSWGHMAIPWLKLYITSLSTLDLDEALTTDTNLWGFHDTRHVFLPHIAFMRDSGISRNFTWACCQWQWRDLGWLMVDLWWTVIIGNKLMQHSSQNTEAEIWSAGSVGTVAIKLWNLETVTIWHCSGLIKLVSSWTIWYCFFELIVPWPGDRKETDKKKLWDIQSKSFYCLS